MAPQFWGPVVFILHLERLPGPGARVHVQQPSILEELQEKQQQQGSGVVQVTSHTHTRAEPRSPSCTVVTERASASGRRANALAIRSFVYDRWPGTSNCTWDPVKQRGFESCLWFYVCVCVHTDRKGTR